MDKSKMNKPILAAFFTIFFWSSAFTASKYALSYLSPEALMLFRFLVASAVFVVIALVKKTKPPEKKDLPIIIVSSFIGLFMYMWLFNTGSKLGTPGVAGFIIASSPVFASLISAFFLKERLPAVSWIGIAVSFVGLVVVAYGKNAKLEGNAGFFMLLGAAVATSVYNIMQRSILKKYDSIRTTMYSIWFATAFMLLFSGRLAAELPLVPLSCVVTVIYLGVFPAALAYLLWNYALSGVEKTIHATGFLYLSPFLTLVTAYFLLGETIPALSLAGGVVIILGLLLPSLYQAVGRKKNG